MARLQMASFVAVAESAEFTAVLDPVRLIFSGENARGRDVCAITFDLLFHIACWKRPGRTMGAQLDFEATELASIASF